MLKIAQWGAMPFSSHELNESGTNLKQVVDGAGQNIGNLAIGTYVNKQFSNTEYIGFAANADVVNKKYDMLLIAAANFINPSFDLGRWADFLEKINIPVVCIGIGAQAPAFSSYFKVSAGTERFIKILSEKTDIIGTRGYYTAEILNSWGIKNVEPIGCPTSYSSCKNMYKKPELGDIKNVSLTGSNYQPDVLKKSLQTLSDVEYKYFAQDEYVWMEHFKNKTIQGGVFKAQLDGAEYGSARAMPIYYCSTIAEWGVEAAECDFAFGTRMHGNMVAFKNGVPTVWVHVDSRTQELCEYLGLPGVSKAKFLTDGSLDMLANVYEASNFEEKYVQNYAKYHDFLCARGLGNNIKLEAPAVEFKQDASKIRKMEQTIRFNQYWVESLHQRSEWLGNRVTNLEKEAVSE